jgi:hypothetical protein
VTRTNHLRLMIDYNLVDPDILDALNKLNAVKLKTIIECGFEQGEKDEVLVNKGTVEQRRILLTGDKKTITKHKYKPCKHGGVIVIKDPRPDAEKVFAWMKAFIQSGKRTLAINHFTYLRSDGATIYTHKEPVEVRF